MTSRISRLFAVLASALVGAALVLLAPTAALAHDTLVSSDPADGAALESSPAQLTLDFSADILDVTPVVRIVGADGQAVQEVTPAVWGRSAVATLSEPLPAGEYTVQWRVVSSDGHPIEGDFGITVQNDPAPTADPAAEATPSADASAGAAAQTPAPSSAPAGAEPSATPSAEPAVENSQSSAMMPLLLGVAAVALIAAIAAVLVSRRRAAGRIDRETSREDPRVGR